MADLLYLGINAGSLPAILPLPQRQFWQSDE
jgi:hypothetical protein